MADKKVTKKVFVNPFKVGVTYDAFLKAIPKNVSVANYCKDNLSADKIKWLEIELEHFKNNKK